MAASGPEALAPLEALLRQPALWRLGSAASNRGRAWPTGFAELDLHLPGGGWPEGALTEILIGHEGIGEIRLLLPALAAATASGRWLALVAPPYVPYLPALVRHGVEPARLLLMSDLQDSDALWAAEQSLGCGACGAVVLWHDALDARASRRLQLAAERGSSAGFVFRPAAARHRASSAALRIALAPEPDGLRLEVLKCRGARAGGCVRLEVSPP